uniref:hypothetical protein n=1 Tax=uncultured Draconibacterium sp. TaxID=1573823 RepID=UPI003216684B
MKKITLIIFLLTAGFSFVFAQNEAEITMKKVFGGYQFYQGDQRLNMKGLVNAVENNEQAFAEMKAARSTYTFATIMSGAAGFMIGYPVGTAIGGGDPNWALAGIGAGLILVSIPISQKFNKQAKQAVDTYNAGLPTSSFWDKNELRLSMTGNGVGLTLWF